MKGYCIPPRAPEMKPHQSVQTQLTEAVEYTDWISADGWYLPNERPGYDIKPSVDESPASEPWGIRSTPSLPLFPDSLWPEEVVSDSDLSLRQIILFDI